MSKLKKKHFAIAGNLLIFKITMLSFEFSTQALSEVLPPAQRTNPAIKSANTKYNTEWKKAYLDISLNIP